MAMEIADAFTEMERPEIVFQVARDAVARDVYGILKSRSEGAAVLFYEYWHSYRITGRVPECRKGA